MRKEAEGHVLDISQGGQPQAESKEALQRATLAIRLGKRLTSRGMFSEGTAEWQHKYCWLCCAKRLRTTNSKVILWGQSLRPIYTPLPCVEVMAGFSQLITRASAKQGCPIGFETMWALEGWEVELSRFWAGAIATKLKAIWGRQGLARTQSRCCGGRVMAGN